MHDVQSSTMQSQTIVIKPAHGLFYHPRSELSLLFTKLDPQYHLWATPLALQQYWPWLFEYAKEKVQSASFKSKESEVKKKNLLLNLLGLMSRTDLLSLKLKRRKKKSALIYGSTSKKEKF